MEKITSVEDVETTIVNGTRYARYIRRTRQVVVVRRDELWWKIVEFIWRLGQRLGFLGLIQIQSMLLTAITVILLARGDLWTAFVINILWSMVVTGLYEFEIAHGRLELMSEEAMSKSLADRGATWYMIGWKAMIFSRFYDYLVARPEQSVWVKAARKFMVGWAFFWLGCVPNHRFLKKEGFSAREVYYSNLLARIPNSVLTVLLMAGSVAVTTWLFWQVLERIEPHLPWI